MKLNKETYFVNSSNERKRLDLKFNIEQSKQELIDMGFKEGMSFLDVGCGSGNMVNLVSDLDVNNSNTNIVGVDKNKEFGYSSK